MKKLELTLQELLKEKPFYAHFYLNCKVSFDKDLPAAAGVSLRKSGIEMIFNPNYIDSMPHTELAAIIEHEILHVLFEHTNYFKPSPIVNLQIANFAMDCSINQWINNLPDWVITLESVSKLVGKKLEPKQTWEYYYSHLLEKVEEAVAKLKTLDSHLESEEGLSEDEAKAIMRSAADKAQQAAKGNTPEHVQKLIDSLRFQHQINWKQMLRNFIARSTSSTILNTRRKTHRRFELDFPGKKKKRELTLGVCVDSSGSVSDDDYAKFMTEILVLSKQTVKTYIIDADCVVQDVQVVKKGKGVITQRHGCGATAYQPAIDKAVELNCDAIIYFGDFDTSDTPQDPKKPFLWVGVGSQKKPGDFGLEVRIS